MASISELTREYDAREDIKKQKILDFLQTNYPSLYKNILKAITPPVAPSSFVQTKK